MSEEPRSVTIEYPRSNYSIEVILSNPKHITIWNGPELIKICDSVDSALDWVENH